MRVRMTDKYGKLTFVDGDNDDADVTLGDVNAEICNLKFYLDKAGRDLNEIIAAIEWMESSRGRFGKHNEPGVVTCEYLTAEGYRQAGPKRRTATDAILAAKAQSEVG